MSTLLTTYEAITRYHQELTFESFDVVKIVNDYRMFWKPERIKTILLAESHVFTNEHETLIKHNIQLRGYPTSYVRFVYNLAYGQNNALSDPLPKNTGTPQFWALFNEISEKNYRVVNNPNPKDKLEQKIQLLHDLKEQGIWLLDCSIVGLYQNGVKPSVNEMNSILTTSYLNYIKSILLEVKPDNILVIGKNIYNLLQPELRMLNVKYDWIHQPNARVTSEKRKSISKIDFICI